MKQTNTALLKLLLLSNKHQHNAPQVASLIKQTPTQRSSSCFSYQTNTNTALLKLLLLSNKHQHSAPQVASLIKQTPTQRSSSCFSYQTNTNTALLKLLLLSNKQFSITESKPAAVYMQSCYIPCLMRGWGW